MKLGPATLFAVILASNSLRQANAANETQEPDGLRLTSNYAEVLLGDRLFFETRFAQYFFAHSPGDVNTPLEEGDRLVDNVPAINRPALPGPPPEPNAAAPPPPERSTTP